MNREVHGGVRQEGRKAGRLDGDPKHTIDKIIASNLKAIFPPSNQA